MRRPPLRSALLALALSLCTTGVAHAESPWMVGLATAGGEIGGAAVGGLAGLAGGAALCELSASWECYLPLLTMPVGGTVGGVGGATWASSRSARAQGLDHRRARRWTALTGLAGTAVTGLGIGLGSDPLAIGGAVFGAVGMPLAAGLAVGSDPGGAAEPARRLSVALTPSAGLGQAGLRLDGRF